MNHHILGDVWSSYEDEDSPKNSQTKIDYKIMEERALAHFGDVPCITSIVYHTKRSNNTIFHCKEVLKDQKDSSVLTKRDFIVPEQQTRLFFDDLCGTFLKVRVFCPREGNFFVLLVHSIARRGILLPEDCVFPA